jgi:hypothetical protein
MTRDPWMEPHYKKDVERALESQQSNAAALVKHLHERTAQELRMSEIEARSRGASRSGPPNPGPRARANMERARQNLMNALADADSLPWKSTRDRYAGDLRNATWEDRGERDLLRMTLTWIEEMAEGLATGHHPKIGSCEKASGATATAELARVKGTVGEMRTALDAYHDALLD